MELLPPDFESGAYTNFATPARIKNDKTIFIMRQPTAETFTSQIIIAKHWFHVIN